MINARACIRDPDSFGGPDHAPAGLADSFRCIEVSHDVEPCHNHRLSFRSGGEGAAFPSEEHLFQILEGPLTDFPFHETAESLVGFRVVSASEEKSEGASGGGRGHGRRMEMLQEIPVDPQVPRPVLEQEPGDE